jgi:hypothetical protein
VRGLFVAGLLFGRAPVTGRTVAPAPAPARLPGGFTGAKPAPDTGLHAGRQTEHVGHGLSGFNHLDQEIHGLP